MALSARRPSRSGSDPAIAVIPATRRKPPLIDAHEAERDAGRWRGLAVPRQRFAPAGPDAGGDCDAIADDVDRGAIETDSRSLLPRQQQH